MKAELSFPTELVEKTDGIFSKERQMRMAMKITEVEVEKIIFLADLYPRIKTDHITVQKYAEDLTVLPPIEINQKNELIDGWHRWTAHKKQSAESIPVFITETRSDTHLLELAIERNSQHGLQLSQEDKRDMARKIYHVTPERERIQKKKHLAKILSVSERTVNDWLSRIDKDSKEARDKKIFELWMACYTQQEIAEIVGCDKATVSRALDELLQNGKLSKTQQPAAEHLTGFDIPIYNVWKFKEKTSGSEHFGNSEPAIVDNLLYLYTKPFDIVVDPFGGGGSTIDICKKRYRRYWVSDLIPITEREKEIRQWDLLDGLPKLPQWKDVKLVYLDPPYWKQAEGKYSNSDHDFANMPLDQFHKSLETVINLFSKKMSAGSYIALLMQPTQWKSPEKKFNDHLAQMIRNISLSIKMRISCPYESQQCTAQMVEWAKANKQLLVISRELVIWEK